MVSISNLCSEESPGKRLSVRDYLHQVAIASVLIISIVVGRPILKMAGTVPGF